MIKIFQPTDKLYATNGDIVVSPLKCKIHKADNSDFYLEIETDLSYIDFIKANNIIVAPTPQGDQAFRISNDIEKSKTKIYAKAYHVFYDSKNYLIKDAYVVDKNCNDALDHLNNSTDNPSPFDTISDITNINTFRCVRKSLYEAIETVIERWGGHLVRDNWTIGIRDTIGQDNGIVVKYKKNLKEISCVENWNEVCTKLLPVGKDGILLDEVYVYSSTQYDIPYTKSINFQQDIDAAPYTNADGTIDEEQYNQALKDDLRQQAIAYVEEHSIPQVNYTLSANIEKVSDIGDVIKVEDERLGIDITTNIISYDYDCILNRYVEIEFGNFKNSLEGLVPSINNTINNAIENNNTTLKVTLGDELSKAQNEIWNALGSSYCIYEGDRILVVDSLPKETAREVLVINNNGIAFGHNGINGAFTSAWTIDGTLNMQNINVINLTADLIRGGTLKLGGYNNQSGRIELYNENNNLIGELNKNGLKMYGADGSYVLLNNEVGFAGYDFEGHKIYWADKDEFHMKKAFAEEEITIVNKMRFIPITIYDDNDNVVNDGIGLVSVSGGE